MSTPVILQASPFVPIVRDAVVESKTLVARDVVSLILRFEGDDLPPMPAGSHVELHLPGGLVRQYSVCRPLGRDGIEIAVLRVERGRGGSRAVHEELAPGSHVLVGRARNDFALAEASGHVLVAGGIGITAILAMARELTSIGAPWEAHYCGSSRERMAFVEELEGLGAPVYLHISDEGSRLDPRTLVANLPPGTAVAVCGPTTMADEFAALFEEFPQIHGRMERFQGRAASDAADTSFELVLADSELETIVRADQTVLDAIESLGVFVPTACLQGTCGSCATGLLEGEPDHRDAVLTREERADQLCVCVSRCRSGRLVLDL